MYKVLIAEDESIERKVLCKILRKHLGEICTITEAKNGTEAWECYQQEQPHVAILDIQMPGMTGLEVAGKIRDTGSACALIFLSAYDYFSYARQAIAYRAVDYILKPYGEEELVSSVEEAIRLHDWYAFQHGRKKTVLPRGGGAETYRYRLPLRAGAGGYRILHPGTFQRGPVHAGCGPGHELL